MLQRLTRLAGKYPITHAAVFAGSVGGLAAGGLGWHNSELGKEQNALITRIGKGHNAAEEKLESPKPGQTVSLTWSQARKELNLLVEELEHNPENQHFAADIKTLKENIKKAEDAFMSGHKMNDPLEDIGKQIVRMQSVQTGLNAEVNTQLYLAIAGLVTLLLGAGLGPRGDRKAARMLINGVDLSDRSDAARKPSKLEERLAVNRATYYPSDASTRLLARRGKNPSGQSLSK